nr:hypothetical protein [Escherichia coli]
MPLRPIRVQPAAREVSTVQRRRWQLRVDMTCDMGHLNL